MKRIRVGQIISYAAILLATIAALTVMLYKNHESNSVQNGYFEEIAISTPDDLVALSNRVNAGDSCSNSVIYLAGDIDMSEVADFVPIGIYDSENNFGGLFDGRGYTISNLHIQTEGEEAYCGLFGVLSGTVCNLQMCDCFVSGNVAGLICGNLVGGPGKLYNCGTVGCEVTNGITSGLWGYSEGELLNCVWNGDGEAEALNANLDALSEKYDEVTFCEWQMLDGQTVLCPDQKHDVYELSLEVKGVSRTDSYKATYRGGKYYFIIPDYLQGVASIYQVEGGDKKPVEEDIKIGVETSLKDDVNRTASVSLEESGDASVRNPEENMEGSAYSNTLEMEAFVDETPCQIVIGTVTDAPSVFVKTGTEDAKYFLNRKKENIVFNSYMEVLDENGVLNYKGTLESIHGRGNDSWYAFKKSLALKCGNAADILQMGADYNYALIAGYRDNSLLGYKVIQSMVKELPFEYAPEYRIVNFYLDGEYMGLYILAEKINIGYNRINIDASGKDVSGGYIFEFSNEDYAAKEYSIDTNIGNHYVVRDMGTMDFSDKQRNYVTDLWNAFEAALYNPTGYDENGRYYADYIDLESFARIWLACEMIGEFSVENSMYFYKDSDSKGDGKIHALYPWDVEHAFYEPYCMNNLQMSLESGFRNGFWAAFYQHDDFKEAVRELWWNDFRDVALELIDAGEQADAEEYIDREVQAGADRYADAEAQTERRVPYIYRYAEQYANDSAWSAIIWPPMTPFQDKAEQIDTWMKNKIPFLDENL